MGRSRDLADGTLAELNVDSNTLAVDATNNRVGIGTSSPARPLHVTTTGYHVASFIASGAETNIAIQNTGTNGRNWNIIAGGNGGAFSSGQFGIYDATVGAPRLAIDSSGRVTMPYQPCFAAYRNGNQNYTANNSFKIELNAVDFDIGSNFNTSTNRFTAPVSGIYLFTASIQYQTVGLAHTNLYKNGGGVSDGWLDFGDAAASSQTRVMSLSAGDYIELYGYNSAGNTVSSQRTKMTGFLIG